MTVFAGVNGLIRMKLTQATHLGQHKLEEDEEHYEGLPE
jgi:hypothetical protein